MPPCGGAGRHIADQPRSRFVFPSDSPRPPTGSPLTPEVLRPVSFRGRRRDTLYQLQSHPIRVLVDFGFHATQPTAEAGGMPEPKAWLDRKE